MYSGEVLESFIVFQYTSKKEEREEKWKGNPQKEMDDRRIFMTSQKTLFSVSLRSYRCRISILIPLLLAKHVFKGLSSLTSIEANITRIQIGLGLFCRLLWLSQLTQIIILLFKIVQLYVSK